MMSHTSSSRTSHRPPPLVRRQARVTLIEDEVQVNIPTYHYPSKLIITSPMTDDVPTPRAQAPTNTPATDATSVASSMWSRLNSRSSFDSLYDVTDNEGEEVPLRLSASVKKHVSDKERSRYPSLVIPSPSQWPSIYKQQPQPAYAVGLSPVTKLASPSAYSVWQAQRLRVPSGTSTPSLDGSLTSEELALSSCPSTPDLASREHVVDEWEPPCQLHPDAFETLHQLNPEEVESDVVETVLEVPEEAALEMEEILKSTPVRLDFALLSVPQVDSSSQDPISALSVPSPGGFFSSLAPVAAQTWRIRTPEPTTGVAEYFYGVPWRAGYTSAQRTTIVTSLSPTTRGPPTAIRDVFSPIDREIDIAEIIDVHQPCEYNQAYQEKLKQSALAHFERTKGWLDDQFVMLRKTVTKTNNAPSTPDMGNSPVSASSSPSKKSVRFAPSPRPSTETGMTSMPNRDSAGTATSTSAINDDTIFLDGFQSIMKRLQRTDTFVHRQTRLETIHIQRRNFSDAYCRHISNTFATSATSRPSPARPISTMLPAPDPEDDEKRETIAAVERERQVLEQVSPGAWELQALSYLHGGRLLRPELISHIKQANCPQILDFGGKPNCDWAWQIATMYPRATVCTIYPGSHDLLPGPPNHIPLEMEKPFALPFADNTFDIISARSLHSLVKNDEMSLTLGELHRVLKPDGYLDFCILDALLINVCRDSWGQVMNAEFGHKLQSRGYDREPTKHFVGKLQQSGFETVKRGFVFLGMGDACPTWKDAGKSPVKLSSSAASASTASASSGLGRSRQKNATVHWKVAQRDADGNVMYDAEGAPLCHAPALTGSTSAISPVTGLLGARMWEQWVYKLARETGGQIAEAQMLEQVCGVLEQGGKMGSGFGCLMGWARK